MQQVLSKWERSGCCFKVGNKWEFHEQCDCKANINFCKQACDEDHNCKGYVAHESNGYCQIATTTTCPTTNDCKKYQYGLIGDLDPTARCGNGFEGCFIKQ